MDANALYAACGNDQGFDDTNKRLEAEFPDEPRSMASKIVQEVALPSAAVQADDTIQWFAHYAVSEIDHGGMAVVYEARKDDKVIALKTIRKEYVNNLELRERFMREVEISRKLNHPNIVRIFEAALYQGVPYFTMELLKGEALHKPIAAKRRFPPRLAAQIAMQIAGALEYAHLQDILHRDLKPSNVMLLEGGYTIKVMDFGIAQSAVFERMTATGLIVGTPPYMSPRRLAGEPATRGDDLYALGLITYEMLTGERAHEWTRRIAEDHIHPPPSEFISDLPPALDAIVSKLLSRHADAGYVYAGALLSDLKAFVGPD
jgi:serine/threonine-protein kinase